MQAPGERLVGDADVERYGEQRELPQVAHQIVEIAACVRRGRRTNEQHARAERGFGFRPGGPPPPTFVGVNGTLGRQLNGLETGDIAPTEAMQAEYVAACKDLAKAVTTFNAVVAQHHLTQAALAAPRCGG